MTVKNLIKADDCKFVYYGHAGIQVIHVPTGKTAYCTGRSRASNTRTAMEMISKAIGSTDE